jgi:hypothetical protein
MCSQNSFSSDQVVREANVAGELKKPFIALQLNATEFHEWHSLLC